MAHLAGSREPLRDMVGIRRLVKVGQMTTDARRRRTSVLSAHMAIGAFQIGMQAGQRKLGVLRVIEASARPVGSRMTNGAVGRESSCDVTGIGSGFKQREVTAGTISW